ncbi:unnamed protein product [Miscanthus lutarioriparius]|uniref:Uncharacterized protein n=1 Tax=Miscanthus lutarioriparius TaxID=422564 RepID=A0A811RQE4_9POAL|nr:unnamed protein product [Miscanthus lutarioriparius]
MGQGAAKAKQGGEEAVQKTPEKKDAKKAHTSSDANALIEFMKKNYDAKVKDVTEFDEFYHAIYELIEKFCEERGQLQYRIPPKEELKEKYELAAPYRRADFSFSFLRVFPQAQKFHKGRGTKVTAQEFENIAKAILKIDSFTFGKAAVDILVVLFGVPVCALLTKRFVPGLKAISDDIVIPAATSGAVVYLAKSNKL